MKTEPHSLPFFFAAGFSVKEGQEADNQRYQLNQLLESLFYLRFNKSFELIEEPVISLPNSISFTCRLSSNAKFLEQQYQASIAAKFTFTCADTAINDYDLECTHVSSLNLHEINADNEEKSVIPYTKWGCDLFNDQLETLYQSLARSISTYHVKMLSFFRNGGLDLFDMLEYAIERDAAEKSAYSLAKVTIKANEIEVEKSFILRTLDFTNPIGSATYLKKAYLSLGESIGLLHGFELVDGQAKAIDIGTCDESYDFKNFKMGNKNQCSHLTIGEIRSLSVDELKAIKSVMPTAIDIDEMTEKGILIG